MINKNYCCGCTACVHICPVKCIEMRECSDGFLYPVADSVKCIDCHKCEQVCPVESLFNLNTETESFIAYNKNEEVRKQSSSGGIFTAVAEWILNSDGVVFGAAFDENFTVCHIAVSSKEELEKLRGSKYVQSRLGNAYPLVKQHLESNRRVLFTGTACQIAGLKKYLNKPYENLYTVDILCHGVPSPKIWNMYLEDKKKQYGAQIKKAEFRSKEKGWKNFSLNIEFCNGKRYCKPHSEDKFMQMFLCNIDLRPSCHNCRFKGFPRISDMTIGDSWGIEGYMPDMDDDRGTSVVFVHSSNGRQMLEAVSKNLNTREASLDKALPITADSRKPVETHPNRKKFFTGLEKGEDINTLHGYVKKSIFQKGVSFAKYVLRKLSLKQ